MILKSLDYMSYVIKGAPWTKPIYKRIKTTYLDYKTNHVRATKYGIHLYKDWKNKLSKEEKKRFKECLEGYTGSHYSEINEYLRATNGNLSHNIDSKILKKLGLDKKEKLKNLNDKILTLDKAFQRAKTSERLVVYRRVSEWQFPLDKDFSLWEKDKTIDRAVLKEIIAKFSGKTFTEHGFLSTSLSKDPGKSFGDQRYPVLLEVKIPQGTRGIYVGEISKYHDQNELLLKRGYTFRYDRFTIIIGKNGRQSLKVEVSLVEKNQTH